MQNAKCKAQEKKLVKHILDGDKRAFEGFYNNQIDGLRRYILSRVSDLDVAEELVQDCFLSFLDSLPVFSFRSSLKTFLYSIARHEIADYFRRKYAKRVLKLVPVVGDLVDEKLYLTDELSAQIEKAYEKLFPGQSLILRLKYEEGLSVKEIAKKLKISIKAAESRLFRARKAFQVVYTTMSNE